MVQIFQIYSFRDQALRLSTMRQRFLPVQNALFAHDAPPSDDRLQESRDRKRRYEVTGCDDGHGIRIGWSDPGTTGTVRRVVLSSLSPPTDYAVLLSNTRRRRPDVDHLNALRYFGLFDAESRPFSSGATTSVRLRTAAKRFLRRRCGPDD